MVKAGLGVLILAGMLALPQMAKAQEAGDFLVRARGILVVPDVSSTVSLIGGDVDADNSAVPEVDFSYFFTDNIAVELILATTRHDMSVDSSAIGDVDLGEVWLLPPTLTVQYHFKLDSGFTPYVGAGLNYTIFYGEDAPGGTVVAIDYENGIGYALQVGLDYGVGENWVINADLKKIFLNTDVKVNGGAINADVDLDPWIFGVGIGYRF